MPLVAIPIAIRARFQNQARSDGPPETTRAALVLLLLACGYLGLLSTTFIRVTVVIIIIGVFARVVDACGS